MSTSVPSDFPRPPGPASSSAEFYDWYRDAQNRLAPLPDEGDAEQDEDERATVVDTELGHDSLSSGDILRGQAQRDVWFDEPTAYVRPERDERERQRQRQMAVDEIGMSRDWTPRVRHRVDSSPIISLMDSPPVLFEPLQYSDNIDGDEEDRQPRLMTDSDEDSDDDGIMDNFDISQMLRPAPTFVSSPSPGEAQQEQNEGGDRHDDYMDRQPTYYSPESPRQDLYRDGENMSAAYERPHSAIRVGGPGGFMDFQSDHAYDGEGPMRGGFPTALPHDWMPRSPHRSPEPVWTSTLPESVIGGPSPSSATLQTVELTITDDQEPPPEVVVLLASPVLDAASDPLVEPAFDVHTPPVPTSRDTLSSTHRVHSPENHQEPPGHSQQENNLLDATPAAISTSSPPQRPPRELDPRFRNSLPPRPQSPVSLRSRRHGSAPPTMPPLLHDLPRRSSQQQLRGHLHDDEQQEEAREHDRRSQSRSWRARHAAHVTRSRHTEDADTTPPPGLRRSSRQSNLRAEITSDSESDSLPVPATTTRIISRPLNIPPHLLPPHIRRQLGFLDGEPSSSENTRSERTRPVPSRRTSVPVFIPPVPYEDEENVWWRGIWGDEDKDDENQSPLRRRHSHHVDRSAYLPFEEGSD